VFVRIVSVNQQLQLLLLLPKDTTDIDFEFAASTKDSVPRNQWQAANGKSFEDMPYNGSRKRSPILMRGALSA